MCSCVVVLLQLQATAISRIELDTLDLAVQVATDQVV